jgi:hypothetical protein
MSHTSLRYDQDDAVIRQKRPKAVISITYLAIILSGFFAIRFLRALQLWGLLSSYQKYLPLYLLISGIFWCVSGAIIAYGLWFAKPRADKITKLFTILWIAYLWVNIYWVNQINNFPGNLFWLLALSAGVILLVFWGLSRPDTKRYFGEFDDH